MRGLTLLCLVLLCARPLLAAEEAGLADAQPQRDERTPGETLEDDVNFAPEGEVSGDEETGEEEVTFEEEVAFGDDDNDEVTTMVNADFPEHDYEITWLLLPATLLGLAALNTRWRNK